MKIKDNIKEILKQGNIQDNIYFLPKIQLDRKDYIECNSILEVLGLKWNKGKKAHILAEEIEDLKETLNDILESGEVETIKEYKKRFQAFYTPKEVAEYLVELAELKRGDKVLEPSVGMGDILGQIPRLYKTVAIELDKQKYDHLRQELCYQDDEIINMDFLDYNEKTFDKIIANPPFSKSQDVKHILHMYELLNEGGRIVSVASSSIQWREGKLYDELRSLNPEFIELPAGSFKESGTMVNSIIVLINK